MSLSNLRSGVLSFFSNKQNLSSSSKRLLSPYKQVLFETSVEVESESAYYVQRCVVKRAWAS